MKPKTLILLMVAIGCGLVAAFLASQATGKGQVQKVGVVVAKQEVRAGMFITEKNREALFEMKELPQDALPPNAVTDISKLNKKIVQRTIDLGAPVNMVRDVADSAGLANALAPGQRAVTLRVTIDGAGAGFILPGSRVDLICNMPDPKAPQQVMSKIFLQNILVLAINTEDSKPADSKVMAQPGLVTLALSPQDAEKAIRVSKDGVPYMVLRRNDDSDPVKTLGALSAFGRNNTDVETITPDTKNVLVAKKTITEGTTIDKVDEFFEATALPSALVPEGAISNPKDVQGQRVKFIGAKTPVTHEYLMASTSTVSVKEEPRPVITKPHRMKIFQGATRQDVDFPAPGSELISAGTPTGPGVKDGGSEGK